MIKLEHYELKYLKQKRTTGVRSSHIGIGFHSNSQTLINSSEGLIPAVRRIRIEILNGGNNPAVPAHYQENPYLWHPVDEIIDFTENVGF